MLIDGIDNTEMISQTFVVRPAVEGIQEFKVITNNAGAEYGRSAGAVVVVTTKAGGNNFHGSVFEFFRNSAAGRAEITSQILIWPSLPSA